jgi:hypothetical protein
MSRGGDCGLPSADLDAWSPSDTPVRPRSYILDLIAFHLASDQTRLEFTVEAAGCSG